MSHCCIYSRTILNRFAWADLSLQKSSLSNNASLLDGWLVSFSFVSCFGMIGKISSHTESNDSQIYVIAHAISDLHPNLN